MPKLKDNQGLRYAQKTIYEKTTGCMCKWEYVGVRVDVCASGRTSGSGRISGERGVAGLVGGRKRKGLLGLAEHSGKI